MNSARYVSIALVVLLALDWSLSVDERRSGNPYGRHYYARVMAMLTIAVVALVLS